jgi:large subunit ribosomal protein L32
MGAVPKKKISKARRDRRRAHDKLTPFVLVACPNCGEMRRSHRMCPSCFTYRGRQIMAVAEE